ncbi:MAG: hypothetical protein WBC05_12305 [Sedimentisphaerales bacterium]
MPESDITKRPKPDAGDVAHALKKAVISTTLGSVASELFSLVVTPSLEKRRDKWIESIAERLKALEGVAEGFKVEDLKDNEAFVSTLINASQAAIRNHQKEKLEALRNAVLNAALLNAPEEDLQHMFLNIVDSFTPSHLKILKGLDELELIEDIEVPKSFFFHLKDQPDLCNQIIKDLRSHGLTHLCSPWEDDISRTHLDEGQNVTDLGKKFLQFIASPFEGE